MQLDPLDTQKSKRGKNGRKEKEVKSDEEENGGKE